MPANIPSSMLEENIPIFVSDAARLAPHEIYRPPKIPTKGTTELSTTDRNRRRRTIKAMRKRQHKNKEVQMRALARLDPKMQRASERRDALKSLANSRNVTILEPKKRRQYNQHQNQNRQQSTKPK